VFPDRFRGFCGFNPLKDYAIEELGPLGVVEILARKRLGAALLEDLQKPVGKLGRNKWKA